MTALSTAPIKVLIVDDSAFMRKALSMMLESDPQIIVIGTARDGEEGIQKVKLLKPDLVTMDIEMPRMDGLTALRQIMTTNPVPVMMVSSLTTDGASATLDALEMGAVDFIPKQLSYVSLDIVKIKDDLLQKIKNIARRKNVLMARYRTRIAPGGTSHRAPGSVAARRAALAAASQKRAIAKRHHAIGIIAIGSSTGGPPALQEIIPNLPRNLPVGVLIAQHMPATFTASLAERLNGLSQVTVKEASNGDPIQPGIVYIAPGGQHMTVRKHGGRASVVVSTMPSNTLYKPCVDIMMKSVAEAYHRTTMGVILTGMGNNGLEGSSLIKTKGGIIIAQDEPTSVVYGMPRAVAQAGVVDHVAAIHDVCGEIISYF